MWQGRQGHVTLMLEALLVGRAGCPQRGGTGKTPQSVSQQ